jgi:hypothetical protein
MSHEGYDTMTGSLVDGVKSASQAVKNDLIVLWEHLPTWQQDNHYILSGYRAASNSFKDSAASIGYLHNETVNIWTHLLGSVAFTAGSIVLWHSLLPRYETASSIDVKVFASFFLGAVVCLGMSATFHTISNHSEAVSRFGNKLDYLGIVFLIWGSFIPAIYYGFSCDPEWINTYWAMVSSRNITSGESSSSNIDHHHRGRDCDCCNTSCVCDSSLETVSSCHVHNHGFIGCVSSSSWSGLVWCRRHEASHGTTMDCP